MKLTDQQIDNIINKLEALSPDGIVCPICGKKQWDINNIVIESREFQQGNFIIGGNSAIAPFVTISCRNCAHTLFFNAIQIGVVNSKQNNN